MAGTKEDPLKRFSRMYDDACILWNGSKVGFGHGQFYDGKRNVLAHRFVYELRHGPIPDDLNVLHSCDNPACINWRHLRAGTQQDNVNDMVGRKRQRKSKFNLVDLERMKDLGRSGLLQLEIARYFDCSQGHISELLSGKIEACPH